MIKIVIALYLFITCNLASAQDVTTTKLIPLPTPSRDMPSDSVLTARKWHVELPKPDNPKGIVLHARPIHESFITFKTDHTFVLYIKEKDCTSILQGRYRIILTDMEADKRTPTLQAQLFSFTKDKNTPKCVDNLIFFLESLDLESRLYPSQGKIVLKKHDIPAVAPVAK